MGGRGLDAGRDVDVMAHAMTSDMINEMTFYERRARGHGISSETCLRRQHSSRFLQFPSYHT